MRVKDIMTNSVRLCRTDTDLAVASRIMCDNDCGILAVVDKNQMVVGVITDRDICIAVGAKQQPACDIEVGNIISGELYTCSPDDSIKDVLEIMRRKQVRRLIVMELEGLLKGIISVSDIVLCADKEKEAERPVISYEEIVKTYKAICEPHGLPAIKMKPLRAAVA